MGLTLLYHVEFSQKEYNSRKADLFPRSRDDECQNSCMHRPRCFWTPNHSTIWGINEVRISKSTVTLNSEAARVGCGVPSRLRPVTGLDARNFRVLSKHFSLYMLRTYTHMQTCVCMYVCILRERITSWIKLWSVSPTKPCLVPRPTGHKALVTTSWYKNVAIVMCLLQTQRRNENRHLMSGTMWAHGRPIHAGLNCPTDGTSWSTLITSSRACIHLHIHGESVSGSLGSAQV